MADQEQKPVASEEQKNEFQPPPFALKEPPALKPMSSSAQSSAPPSFSFRTPITPQVIGSSSSNPSPALPNFQQGPMQPLQPLQPLQPQPQPFLQM